MMMDDDECGAIGEMFVRGQKLFFTKSSSKNYPFPKREKKSSLCKRLTHDIKYAIWNIYLKYLYKLQLFN
jgi:hypothetical protein